MLTVEIIGNLGRDAEIKEFGGKKYTTFSLAHTENMRTAEGKTISKRHGYRSSGTARGTVFFRTSQKVQRSLSGAD